MQGPLPKDPAVRQRQNKQSTRAVLDPSITVRTPALPKALFPSGVHPLTRAWWRTIWRSPMASQWLEADVVSGLHILATLMNHFYRAESASQASNLAAEIRQQELRFGLSPIDRRRLDWRIDQPDAPSKGAKMRTDDTEDAEDPRQVLRMVK